MPLVPELGSQVSVSVFVADLNPDEARVRRGKALRAEFGDDTTVARWHKLPARPVADIRVDVRRIGRTEVIAANVLEEEASCCAGGADVDVGPAAVLVGSGRPDQYLVSEQRLLLGGRRRPAGSDQEPRRPSGRTPPCRDAPGWVHPGRRVLATICSA